MLYDPLQDGAARTSKTMQYVAAVVGKNNLNWLNWLNLSWLIVVGLIFSIYIFTKNFISVCLGAVSAGTALAWTAPVLPQLTPPIIHNSTNATNFTELYLDENQRKYISYYSKSIIQ